MLSILEISSFAKLHIIFEIGFFPNGFLYFQYKVLAVIVEFHVWLLLNYHYS